MLTNLSMDHLVTYIHLYCRRTLAPPATCQQLQSLETALVARKKLCGLAQWNGISHAGCGPIVCYLAKFVGFVSPIRLGWLGGFIYSIVHGDCKPANKRHWGSFCLKCSVKILNLVEAVYQLVSTVYWKACCPRYCPLPYCTLSY